MLSVGMQRGIDSQIGFSIMYESGKKGFRGRGRRTKEKGGKDAVPEWEREADEDRYWMREAIREAEKAAQMGEVPIGAVIVRDGAIVGRGHNLRETDKDPTAHAEILALREAARTLGGWRLTDSVMYVTLEPCPMCAGALVQARVKRLVFGAWDPKAGCAGTLMNLVAFPAFNHRLSVTGGVLEEECARLLKRFFQSLRNKPAQDAPRV